MSIRPRPRAAARTVATMSGAIDDVELPRRDLAVTKPSYAAAFDGGCDRSTATRTAPLVLGGWRT